MEMTDDTAITITLNGSAHPLPDELNVDQLLERLGFAGKPVVVEVDEEAIFPRDYAATPVRNGARVELVTLAAGG
jgi:sulfur carrier protein